MCTLGFRGKGYSPRFIKNYKEIAKAIREDEETEIEVVGNMDSICSACPNRQSEVLCKYQPKIDKLDNAHKEALNLEIGERLSWKQAKERIKKHVDVEKFHSICDGCSWKDLGVCQESLEDLLRK